MAESMRAHLLEIQCSSRLGSMRSNYPDGASYLIRMDDRDAGWLYVAEGASEIYVVDVIVRTAFRRQDVASAALLDVIRRASGGGKKVTLRVNISNAAAIRVYSRLGFQRIGGDEVQDFMEHSGELGS